MGGGGGIGGGGGVSGSVYYTARAQTSAPGPVCPNCGMTFNVFKHKGLLGCETCYHAFERVLTPLLSRAHEGGTHHTGKCPTSDLAPTTPTASVPAADPQSSSASGSSPASPMHTPPEQRAADQPSCASRVGPASAKPQQAHRPTPSAPLQPISQQPPRPKPPTPEELDRLRVMLDLAVREERYETAAALRDKINALLAIAEPRSAGDGDGGTKHPPGAR